MPAIYSKLPVLSLLSNPQIPQDFGSCPSEKEIARDILLDVAPDREELLKHKSTEEIRRVLKLNISSTYGHWLYRSQKRNEVKLRDATTRFSVFNRVDQNNDENTLKEDNGVRDTSNHRRSMGSTTRRRVVSASSVHSVTSPGRTSTPYQGLALSTEHRLISPRPMGPTHILVAFATPSSTSTISRQGQVKSVSGRKAITNGIPSSFPEVVELPINDLCFLLNVPNLVPSGKGKYHPVLPRRLHKEMPRVLMQVPHLVAFPELVIYLHTKNQAALFRALIPEWIRDMIHPLPSRGTLVETVATATSTSTSFGSALIANVPGFKVKKLFKSVSVSSFASTANSGGFSTQAKMQRTAYTVAVEIAVAICDMDSIEDILSQTGVSLDALRDNLHHIGYFNKDLWTELDVCRDVVRHAISYRSKMTANVDMA